MLAFSELEFAEVLSFIFDVVAIRRPLLILSGLFI